MINLHVSMGPGQDRSRDPWICSRTRIYKTLELLGKQCHNKIITLNGWTSSADPESFVRGGPNLITFLLADRRSKYRYKWAIIGPTAERHLNGVSLAGRWWPNIECWLRSFVIFQGILTSTAKNSYIFVIFLCNKEWASLINHVQELTNQQIPNCLDEDTCNSIIPYYSCAWQVKWLVTPSN